MIPLQVAVSPHPAVADDYLAPSLDVIAKRLKIPHNVVFVDDFPMTASGKIRKVELREDAKQRAAKN